MGKENFGEHIGHRFRMIHNGIDKFFSCHNLDEYDLHLTHAQTAMIHYLYDHRNQDVFQKDLESCFQISGATASNTLKGLEKQGVITRTPMEEDARKKKLCLTKLGVEFHEKAMANLELLEQTLTRGLSESEVATYQELLGRTIQNLDEETGFCSSKK